jgi:hypothetical protein
MVRVRPISLPQLGHKCVEIRLSPSIVKILKSKPDYAVMAVTVEMDFCRGCLTFVD